MTLNAKNFDSYRKYSTFALPKDLHAAVDELFAEGAWEVKITPLYDGGNSVDGFLESLDKDAVLAEYMIDAEFGA